jgi:hypothetical protein
MSELFIYSTSTGGPAIQKNTERMKNLVKAATKQDAQVVFLDIDQGKKAEVWAVSGKKGVYPLLFSKDNFLGDMAEVYDKFCDCLFSFFYSEYNQGRGFERNGGACRKTWWWREQWSFDSHVLKNIK